MSIGGSLQLCVRFEFNVSKVREFVSCIYTKLINTS